MTASETLQGTRDWPIRCAMDIGGTLAKVVFLLDTDEPEDAGPVELGRERSLDIRKVKFGYFKTKDADALFEWLRGA